MSLPSTSAAAVIAGGMPNHTDTILSGVFIPLFFLVGLLFHFRTFRDYGKKFIWSGLCFSYCIARVVALALRIAVVKNPTNKGLNIAAQILISAGVALLFVVNLQMSRRFYGQLHPHHALPVKRFITGCVVLVVPVIIMVITTVIQSFITHNVEILHKDRQIRLVASVFFVILPFIPIPVVLLVLLMKASSPGGLDGPTVVVTDDVEGQLREKQVANGVVGQNTSLERMQTGNTSGELMGIDRATLVDGEKGQTASMKQKLAKGTSSVVVVGDSTTENNKDVRTKATVTTWIRTLGEPESGFGPVPVGRNQILESAAVILLPAVLLTFEQGVRCVQAFYVHKPGDAIPWYMTKGAFWVCIFGLEILSVLVLGLATLPRRFSHLKLV
ncbi:hypothetical protein FRC18_008357 [Serendipita sp. 400]|nr:hypothetical protein FRC18_008357 [Serendipita sp. 400]